VSRSRGFRRTEGCCGGRHAFHILMCRLKTGTTPGPRMDSAEAKFILRAYRPGGHDAQDPAFAEALAQVERDPALRAWWERERTFDATMAEKIGAMHPPGHLRTAIIAGGKAGGQTNRPRTRWWRLPVWLAAAAAIAVGVFFTIPPREATGGASGLGDLAALAVDDLANAHDDHVGHPTEMAGMQAQLAGLALPITLQGGPRIEDLRAKSCRVVKFAGREVFEVCYQREGTWYHLYVARAGDFGLGGAGGAGAGKPVWTEKGRYAATAWRDANQVYALVTRAGPEALRRLM
jgi:hypothetical protein